MAAEPPKSIEDYKKWLKDEHDVTVDKRTETYYASVVGKIEAEFRDSDFWETFSSEFMDWEREYHISTKYDLWSIQTPPQIITKPFDSFIIKSYRKNVINNPNWPEEPSEGWVLPDNWYENTNDLVRTSIITKYLDGVEHLANKLTVLAENLGLENEVDFEAKEEGYYAAHFYIYLPCEVPTKNWETMTIRPMIELQITTQLQDVIKKMLHTYYDKRRESIEPVDKKWQWDYTGEEFSANYLGHILHYIEGMIMDVRSKQSK